MTEYLVRAEEFRELMNLAFQDIGVEQASRSHIVENLIFTSLRGVDSHGVKLFPYYLKAFQAGRLNKTPQVTTVLETKAYASLDGDFGTGHFAGIVASDRAIHLARSEGLGLVTVKNSTHFGSCAYYGFHIRKAGMLGLVFTNADPLLKHPNTNKSFFGTNPVCLVAPLAKGDSLCIDMATSVVSFNKISNYAREGLEIPMGWGFDESGMPTSDAGEVKTLASFGGYKGFWLAMIVEILTSCLADGVLGNDVIGMYGNEPLSKQRPISQTFMAIDVNRLNKNFEDRISYMVESLRKLPTPEGSVVMADDVERESMAKRGVDGIPVSESLANEFLAVSNRFNAVFKR